VQIVADLEMQRASSPKLHSLPPPRLDPDAWIRLAIKYPKAWRKFVSVLRTSGSPVNPEADKTACAQCGKMVARQGMGAHCARVHAVFRLARAFCKDDGVRHVCQGQFVVRSRCIHHVHYSSLACLAALMSGDFQQLDPEEICRLDALDAAFRRAELKAGRSFVARP